VKKWKQGIATDDKQESPKKARFVSKQQDAFRVKSPMITAYSSSKKTDSTMRERESNAAKGRNKRIVEMKVSLSFSNKSFRSLLIICRQSVMRGRMKC
jgi:hypothetical protein